MSRTTNRLIAVVMASSVLATCCSCQSLSRSNSPPLAVHNRIIQQQAPAHHVAYGAASPPLSQSSHATITDQNVVQVAHVSAAAGTVPVGYHQPIANGGFPATGPLPCPHCTPRPPMVVDPCQDDDSFPYPADEGFLCDGGDAEPSVLVSQDWTVRGLNSEDTVLHFDTVDGERLVAASNRVCLYAPRFASVRKVTGVGLHEQADRAVGLDVPVRALNQEERLFATTVVQPLQPGRNLALKSANAFRERITGVGVDQHQAAARVENELQPFENFKIIRRGEYDANEKLRLATRLQAAITWSHNLGVQVVIDNEAAVQVEGDKHLQDVHTYEMPPGKPRVRIVKVASRDDAKPGDIVEFTLRFDNVGDQVVGNVTIIDNLTTRLEYVPESANCTLKSEFLTQLNDGESLILRWEVKDPISVGEGGLIRFKCRVR